MPIPSRLARKLNETLGSVAAGDLVTWLDEMRAEHLEMRADFAELRQDLRAMEVRVKEDFGGRIHALEVNLRKEIHAVDVSAERRFADLLKWSFVFWCGAVAAIAALAGVLRS